MMQKLLVPVFVLTATACGSATSTIPGTRVPDSSLNREIIAVIEEYRAAVEKQDAQALLLMASPNYWEDGGTPTGGDDYGLEGLKEVLGKRFQMAEDIRYAMRYMSIRSRCPEDTEGRDGCRAYVEVLIDASYTVSDARGQEKRPDMRDQNELVLEWADSKWKFLSGM